MGIAQYGSSSFLGRFHSRILITLSFIGATPLRHDLPHSHSITFRLRTENFLPAVLRVTKLMVDVQCTSAVDQRGGGVGSQTLGLRRRRYPCANFVKNLKVWASVKHAIITRCDRRPLCQR